MMTISKGFAKINAFYMLPDEEMKKVIDTLMERTTAYMDDVDSGNLYPESVLGFVSVTERKNNREIFFPVYVQIVQINNTIFPRYQIGSSIESPDLNEYSDKNLFETTEENGDVSITSFVDEEHDGGEVFYIDYEYGYKSDVTENGASMTSYLRIINSETHFMYQVF